MTPAYGGCTCACHRRPGVMHFMACCHPSDGAPRVFTEGMPIAKALGEPSVDDIPRPAGGAFADLGDGDSAPRTGGTG